MRQCQYCGCTEQHACQHHQVVCTWISSLDDVCSFCEGMSEDEQELRQEMLRQLDHEEGRCCSHENGTYHIQQFDLDVHAHQVTAQGVCMNCQQGFTRTYALKAVTTTSW